MTSPETEETPETPETLETPETPVAKRNLESALSFAASNYEGKNEATSKITLLPVQTTPSSSSGRIEDRLLDYISYCKAKTDHIDVVVQIAKHYIRRAQRRNALQCEGNSTNPLASLIDQLKRVNTILPPSRNKPDNVQPVDATNPPSPPRKARRSPLSRLFPSKTQRQCLPVPPSRRKLMTNLELFALTLQFLIPSDLIGLGLVSKSVALFLNAKGAEPALAKQTWSSVCGSALSLRVCTLKSRAEYLRSQRNRARCILITGSKTGDKAACTQTVYAAAQQSGSTVFELGAGGVNKLMPMPRGATHDWVLPLFSAAKATAPAIVYLADTDNLVGLFNEQLVAGEAERSLYAQEMLYSLLHATWNDFHGDEATSFVTLVAFTSSAHEERHPWQAAFGTHLTLAEVNVQLTPVRIASSTSRIPEYLLTRLDLVDHELSQGSIERIVRVCGISSRESVDRLLATAAKKFRERLHEATHFRRNGRLNKYELCSSTDNGAESRPYTSLRLDETRFGPLRLQDFLP